MQEQVTKKQEESLAIASTPNSSLTSLEWDNEGSLIPLKVNSTEEFDFAIVFISAWCSLY